MLRGRQGEGRDRRRLRRRLKGRLEEAEGETG
jgi:hypothetical protein